jgi:flagellar biosynthesis/type III secretory pathway chaperone
MTNKLADISMLELLQTDQHANMGVSLMSVFNTQKDVNDVRKASEVYSKVLDKAIEAKKKYFQVLDDVKKEREKQSATIDSLKDKEAKEVFAQESNDIIDFKNKVYEKERQLAR